MSTTMPCLKYIVSDSDAMTEVAFASPLLPPSRVQRAAVEATAAPPSLGDFQV